MMIPFRKTGRCRTFFSVVAAAFLFASCGAGGGSGGSGGSGDGGGSGSSIHAGPVELVYPEDGSALSHGSSVSFELYNSEPEEHTNGVYTISIYSDSDALNLVASSEEIEEDQAGRAAWSPTVELGSDRAYWWKWSAVYEDADSGLSKSYESGLGVFYVTSTDAMDALSPADGGYADVNRSGGARLAVFNAYTGEEPEVAYDFELYYAEDTSSALAQARDVPQNGDERYTVWEPAAALLEGVSYKWRAKAVVNGYPMDWSSMYTFTAVDFCSVGGGRYAERVADTATVRECAARAFTDPEEALGPPDAVIPYRGFYSLDFGGELVVEMGATIMDQSGYDIRVYEFVSEEFVEVLVGASESGPWASLGVQLCPEYCDFDLATGGAAYARFIKVRDPWSPQGACHESSGADIDAIMWIRPVSAAPGACAGGW
ncbi:MAG: hypothetical protein ACNS63_08410 [Candidatus Nitrospinota bacterium M3_3B_026]